MALKFKFNSKSEIPADLAAHYLERDGVWVLDADGVADKRSWMSSAIPISRC
jgi:hypothetical protein